MSAESRCPSCGALVSVDAEWCGQCYASLRAAAEEPEPVRPRSAPVVFDVPAPVGETPGEAPEPAAVVPAQAHEGEPAWPCPVCGNRNPVELNACAACGTPFGRLFREAERRPQIPPRDAALWSLIFPGLGHWKCGRAPDGLARMVIFLWTFGTFLVLALSRVGTGGLGPLTTLFAVFLGASLLVWGTSVLDAFRIASGEQPVVSSRMLLWGSVALVVLSVLLASLVVVPAARGG